jgi:hypothetical protein
MNEPILTIARRLYQPMDIHAMFPVLPPWRDVVKHVSFALTGDPSDTKDAEEWFRERIGIDFLDTRTTA